jgi:hypothetical protein
LYFVRFMEAFAGHRHRDKKVVGVFCVFRAASAIECLQWYSGVIVAAWSGVGGGWCACRCCAVPPAASGTNRPAVAGSAAARKKVSGVHSGITHVPGLPLLCGASGGAGTGVVPRRRASRSDMIDNPPALGTRQAARCLPGGCCLENQTLCWVREGPAQGVSQTRPGGVGPTSGAQIRGWRGVMNPKVYSSREPCCAPRQLCDAAAGASAAVLWLSEQGPACVHYSMLPELTGCAEVGRVLKVRGLCGPGWPAGGVSCYT